MHILPHTQFLIDSDPDGAVIKVGQLVQTSWPLGEKVFCGHGLQALLVGSRPSPPSHPPNSGFRSRSKKSR